MAVREMPVVIARRGPDVDGEAARMQRAPATALSRRPLKGFGLVRMHQRRYFAATIFYLLLAAFGAFQNGWCLRRHIPYLQ